jgi:outer membrane lipoprotein
MLRLLPVFWFLLLTACASGPQFPLQGVNRDLQPKAAVAPPSLGQHVLWGGLIIATHNLADHTQLEVLAYPLDANQLPDTSAQPLGRFLANHKGYLEPADYASGRLVTLKGTVVAPREGKIEESQYTYPVVEVTAIYLWPPQEAQETGTQLHFGIGVIFH